MLYLAEVQKQRSGFGLGGGKAELKLLACQRGEHNWSAVPGDDAIPVEEANKFNDGTLVLVELSASKQVQRIQEAARQLVSILQNFSRLQDKFKDKEEEIEQWKASLTFSSQELNRREMEMQAREEQLAQMEDELERLEAQRSEIENTRDEANRLREEVDRSRVEIETAWEQLRGEQQRVAQQQSQVPQGAVVDQQQTQDSGVDEEAGRGNCFGPRGAGTTESVFWCGGGSAGNSGSALAAVGAKTQHSSTAARRGRSTKSEPPKPLAGVVSISRCFGANSGGP